MSDSKRELTAEELRIKEQITKGRQTIKILRGLVKEENGFSKQEIKDVKNQYGEILSILKRIADGLRNIPAAAHHISDDTEDYASAIKYLDRMMNDKYKLQPVIANYLLPEPEARWFNHTG